VPGLASGAFLLEAAVRVVTVYSTTAGTALAISKVMPFLFVGILSAWTVAYGAHRKKKGERMAATTGEVMSASQVRPSSPETTQASPETT
jgi:hypothetical protein